MLNAGTLAAKLRCGCEYEMGKWNRCKKHAVRFSVVVIALIVLLSFAAIAVQTLFIPSYANGATPNPVPCVPFAEKAVPNEARPEWKLTGYHNEGSLSVRYYDNQKAEGLSLGVYSYFGQLAFKAWACKHSGEDPKTSDKKDHRISILKDGKWYTALAQRPDWKEFRASDGRLTGILLSLRNSKGVLIVERTINAP